MKMNQKTKTMKIQFKIIFLADFNQIIEIILS